MEAARTEEQVPTATAGVVLGDVLEEFASLHIADAPTDDGRSRRRGRVAWASQHTVVMVPKDDSRTPDDTAAAVLHGEGATAEAVVEADAPLAGAAAEADTGAAGASPAGAAPTADTGAAGLAEEVPAARGVLPGSSSDAPPPRGALTGRWRGWQDPQRWRWVHGRWIYRSYGEGPETGGNDCPQSADPARTERNRRRKAKKERIRREREADADNARRDAWRRQYEREATARSSRTQEEDSWSEDSERPPAP